MKTSLITPMVAGLFMVLAYPAFAQQESCDGFRTQTPGGWGAPAHGNNPGAYRDAHFATAFPDGVTIGCDTYHMHFSSAAAIEAYLPCGGKAKVLNRSYENPSCIKNVLTGHLLALSLTIGFDNNDPDFGQNSGHLKDAWLNTGPLAGKSILEILSIANDLIGGCSSAYKVSDVLSALSTINENYTDGTMNGGAVSCEANICDDKEAPEVVSGPEDTTIECGMELPDEVPVFSDNEDGQLSITYFEEYYAHGCVGVYLRTWVATDECENRTSYTQQVALQDRRPPEFSDCPADIQVADASEVPPPAQLSAVDDCDGELDVVFESSISKEEGKVCAVTTAQTVYGPDWGMMFFDFLGEQSAYYRVVDGSYEEDVNAGTAHYTVDYQSVSMPSCGWHLELFLENAMTWLEWSDQPFPTGYKDDAGLVQNEYLDWMFYLLSDRSILTGTGDYEGSVLHLSHLPVSRYYGFQKGENANNVGPGYGAGGWFSYSGNIINAIDKTETQVAGAGDFAVLFNCCEASTITRKWTAMDCSENEAVCIQRIRYCELQEVTPQRFYSPIQINGFTPNPVYDHANISYTSTRRGNAQIELYNDKGVKIKNLGRVQVMEGGANQVEIDLGDVTPGMYFVRIRMGNSQVGKAVMKYD